MGIRDRAKLGAECVLVARTQGGLEEVDDAIRAAGGKPATLLPFNLQKAEKDIDMIGPSIVERFGRLDILVHNAGTLNKLTPVAHIDPRDWAEVMAVNLTASWRLIRSCDPPLRASDAGRAVFLTSGAALSAPGPASDHASSGRGGWASSSRATSGDQEKTISSASMSSSR